jgi:hypothetical protein
MKTRTTTAAGRRAGFTINEILFATTIMTVVLLACFTLMQRDVQLQRSTLGISVAETKAQTMLYKLERELADARGESPRATLTANLGPGGVAAADVDRTRGFPDRGFLLVDRDNGAREILSYAGLGGPNSFETLVRGLQCTDPNAHSAGDEVMWAGTAEPIAIQVAPPASTFDGRSLEPGGPLFWRGTGTGFSYRIPTDETGGNDYLDGDDLQWGAMVNNVPTLDGWSALEFVPVWVFDEAVSGEDINRDGDRVDQFDVGQIRRRSWDTANPALAGDDIGLGPTVIIQERCNWGGDLDADGSDDPIFLWNEAERTLHVRLFVLGTSVADLPIVRRVESIVFLRNQPGT